MECNPSLCFLKYLLGGQGFCRRRRLFSIKVQAENSTFTPTWPHTDREMPQSDAKIGSSKFNKWPRPCRRSSRSCPTARRRGSEIPNFTFRLLHLRAARRRESVAKTPVVIEISSSEDDDHGATVRTTPARCVYGHSGGAQAQPRSRNQPPRHRATRKIIESSSESENEGPRNEPPANAIDLTLDGSDHQYFTPVKNKAKTPTRPAVTPKYQPLYSDSENSDSDNDVFEDAIDDSIITLYVQHLTPRFIPV